MLGEFCRCIGCTTNVLVPNGICSMIAKKKSVVDTNQQVTNRFRLSVIIINYRTSSLTIDCLTSLEGELDPTRDRVFLVDNASGDDSIDTISGMIEMHGWSKWVSLLKADLNRGFSAGNNIGLRAAESNYYLLLNSDTLVRPGAIASLLGAAEDQPDAGIISPRLEWPDGTAQVSCFRYCSPATELIAAAGTSVVTKLLKPFDLPLPVSDHPQEMPWTSFACVLLRKELVEQVGLLDEGYFLYYEDVDYCRRVRRADWKILYWPKARVVHLRGQSSSVKVCQSSRKRLPRYYYESRARYFAKYYGINGLWFTNLAWSLGRAVSLIRELVGHKERHVCEGTARDIWINCLTPLASSRGRGHSS